MKLNVSGNCGGSFGVFLIFKNLVSQKQQVLEGKIHPVLCGHCLPSCQAERQAPGLLVFYDSLSGYACRYF